MDALAKEMFNVGVAFEILEHGRKAPDGWHQVMGHLVWDVKMDFTRKAHWVLDGHKTHDPVGSTYAGVVSRESIRIALTYAALNNLQVCVRQTSAMHTSRHRRHRKILSSVDQSLAWRMLVAWH